MSFAGAESLHERVYLSRGRAWALALVATSTMAISYLDRQTLAVLAPMVTRELGMSEASYGLLASAFSLAYLVGAPVAGQWIDALGARRGLLRAVLAWSLVAAMHALVPGAAGLFALRICLGLAEAPSFPGAAQTVHRVLPPAERARGLGVLFTGSSLGAMVAPLVAGPLASRYGWRVAMLGTAAVGLLWVPLWLATAWSPAVRPILDGEREPRFTSSRDEGYRRPAAQDDGARKRISLGKLLGDRAVLRAVLLIFASAPAISFVLLWGSKHLFARYALSSAGIARYLWLPPVLYDLGSLFFGDRAARRLAAQGHRPDRTLVALAMLLAISGGAIAWTATPWQTTLAMGVALAGGGGLYALLTADLLDRVPAGAVSSAGGITAAAQSLVYIIVNPLVGFALDRGVSHGTLALGLALWNLPGCLLWMALRAPPRRELLGAP